MTFSADTIAAVATPRGLGGLGIIRLSGPDSLALLQAMFRKKSRTEPGSASSAPFVFTPSRLEHGWVMDISGRVLDEVMAVAMPASRSFTGEEAAEIHCHGGLAVTEAVLAAALDRGARLACPGEFTRRAWMNGRLDLSQAEAVAEMIAAPTLEGVYLARNKLEGRLGRDLDRLRHSLDALRASLCLHIDFPDEAEEEKPQNFSSDLSELRRSVRNLAASSDHARLWREGALAVLAGRVNVGKSSLLNALLGRKRAIVSDRPGTTRDFIEESLNLDGLPLRLADTAGLRAAYDSVELEGIDFARKLMGEAQVVLLVLEASEVQQGRLDPGDLEIMDAYGPNGTNHLFILLNKADLLASGAVFPAELRGSPCHAVSAETGQGLDTLVSRLRDFVTRQAGALDFNSAAPPGLRQARLLRQIDAELQELENEFSSAIPAELLSVRLDQAAQLLSDITGLSSSEDILAEVFSSFCIGK